MTIDVKHFDLYHDFDTEFQLDLDTGNFVSNFGNSPSGSNFGFPDVMGGAHLYNLRVNYNLELNFPLTNFENGTTPLPNLSDISPNPIRDYVNLPLFYNESFVVKTDQGKYFMLGNFSVDYDDYLYSGNFFFKGFDYFELFPNSAPVLVNDVSSVAKGSTVSGNVLTNDTDLDGDHLTVTALNGTALGAAVKGQYGSLTLHDDGSFSYVSSGSAQLPTSGIGQDSFTYSEIDGHGHTAQATLTVSVIGGNQAVVVGTAGTPAAPNTLTLGTGTGKQALDGSAGYQNVIGGNGADALIGGSHDKLTGGNGADTFIFKGNFGANEVTDFANNDVLQLDKSHFANFAAVQAHAVYDSAHDQLVITDASYGTILLDHVKALQASDVIFA